MTMTLVNIHVAKVQLSSLLDRVAAGERIIICKRNQPVAELRPVEAARTGPRPIGLARGQVELPPAFFDPLPQDLMDAFEAGAVYPAARRPSAAAERPQPFDRAFPRPSGARRRRGGAR